MKYFEKCNTAEELKAEYRRLVKMHHPDRGGDAKTFNEIKESYEARLRELMIDSKAAQDMDELRALRDMALMYLKFYKTGVYVRLMHVKNLTDKWISKAAIESIAKKWLPRELWQYVDLVVEDWKMEIE